MSFRDWTSAQVEAHNTAVRACRMTAKDKRMVEKRYNDYWKPIKAPKRRKKALDLIHPQYGLISEKTFQEQVRRIAQVFGWLYYHPWRSDHSTAGFPDTVLIRGTRLVIAELKKEGKNPTPAQAEWLSMFGKVPGIEVFIWYPSDISGIERVLR